MEDLTSLLGNNEEVTVGIAEGASIHGLVSSIPTLRYVTPMRLSQLVVACKIRRSGRGGERKHDMWMAYPCRRQELPAPQTV